MNAHMLVKGAKVSVDPSNVRVVANELTFFGNRPWMTQLVWDPDAKRFYYSCGEPKVDLGLPGISTDIRLSLGTDTAKRRLVGSRFAFLWASERGVSVEMVEEISGLDCPNFPDAPKPDEETEPPGVSP